MRNLFQTMTVVGRVSELEAPRGRFCLRLLNGDTIAVNVSPTTYYEVLKNVGNDQRDRVQEPSSQQYEEALGSDANNPTKRGIIKYVKPGQSLAVTGIYSQNGDYISFDARRIVLQHSVEGRHGFEDTHWWLQQINTLFEQWLDALFGNVRDFTVNDFAKGYRTHLDLLGSVTDEVTQESATMSRFLYGLSSSYLLTGNERALSAARACAEYLIQGFSVVSHDRRYCFWKFGRTKDNRTTREIVASLNGDDLGSYALYEQIYALSGLAQFYRITQDTGVLSYIRMTVAAFQDFFADWRKRDQTFQGKGGYFSHIDPVTMRPDSPALNLGNGTNNVCKKNWNSVGDHIPAYLINVLLALEPLPKTETGEWKEFRALCRKILDDCVGNILAHFFKDDSPFVNERFDASWNQDLAWGWQQDRAIVGHNLKIAWNLTRCGHYYAKRALELRVEGQAAQATDYEKLSRRCYDHACELGTKMDALGVDQIRGGIWDAVERKPNAAGVHEFAWGNTKDFWQQEQAILAYYIMHGIPGQDEARAGRYLELARACASFWNQFFIDQDNRKMYFRTDESGTPVVQGQYGIMAGHAIAGYHAFELNYLAHVYIRTYVSNDADDNFALVFCPCDTQATKTLNVLPDFMPPGAVELYSVRVNGVDQVGFDKTSFQIDVSRFPNHSRVEVEFRPLRPGAQSAEDIEQRRPTSAALDMIP